MKNSTFIKYSLKTMAIVFLAFCIAACKNDKPLKTTQASATTQKQKPQVVVKSSPEIMSIQAEISKLYATGNYLLQTAKYNLDKRDLQNYNPELKTYEDVIAHMKNEKNAIAIYEYAKSTLDESQRGMYYPLEKYLQGIKDSKETEEYLKKIRVLENKVIELQGG